MRKNLGSKPILYPMPVLIVGAYSEDGVANAMNAAWGGISEEDEISICLSAEHKTIKNIIKSCAFTVSVADEKNLVGADYVGIVSGNDVQGKLEIAGFTPVRSELVNAPLFAELPMTLECKLRSYDEKSCRLVGEIVNVSVDESILGEDGKIDPALLRPITYDPVHHTYRAIGDVVGHAFRDGLKLKSNF